MSEDENSSLGMEEQTLMELSCLKTLENPSVLWTPGSSLLNVYIFCMYVYKR